MNNIMQTQVKGSLLSWEYFTLEAITVLGF